jgi:hypothetical protein
MTLLSTLLANGESAAIERHLESRDVLVRLVTATKLVGPEVELSRVLIDEYTGTLRACLAGSDDELEQRFLEETGEDLNQCLVEPLSGLEPGEFSTLVPDLWSAWKCDRQFYELAHAAVAL